LFPIFGETEEYSAIQSLLKVLVLTGLSRYLVPACDGGVKALQLKLPRNLIRIGR
jgi:hypothetical protein